VQARVLLLSACRLTEYKRPALVIRTLDRLRCEGLDVRLILLGKGEQHDQLQALIRELDLQDRVTMPGYVDNVLDYMAAADFFLHPSILDSSCVAVKEAGLVTRPVIVCRGVGDFDDYLIHKQNGFSVDRDNFVDEAAGIILKHFQDENYLQRLGENLRKTVLDLFGAVNILKRYDQLNKIR